MTRIQSPRPRSRPAAAMIGAIIVAGASAHAGDLANIAVVAAPGSQPATTTPYAINNSGEIAGQYLDPAVGYRVFSLTGGIFTTVDPGPSAARNGSDFVSLNTSGQIVGFADTTTPPDYGYYYLADRTGAISAFPPASTILPAGVSGFAAFNDNGAVAGQAGAEAFVTQGGTTTIINPPTSTATVINAINDKGAIVGQFDPTVPPSPYANQSAFLYQDGVYTTLSAPGAAFTEATGVNDNGVVVGYFDGTPTTAPGGVPVTPIEGFTYDSGVYREYSVPGEAETELFGINDNDQVVGYYGDERGTANGFTATAVPEPGAWTLMLIGLAGFGASLRGRRARAILVRG